jgi:hypothetical protein
VRLRVTFSTQQDLDAALAQMVHGAVLVPAPSEPLAFDAAVELEIVLPDGASVTSPGRVLQILAGHGVAVTIDPALPERLRAAKRDEPEEPEALTHAQKIQIALHGTRDQRNAILRDKNRALHVYVLKNPQITVEDVLSIAKNTQMGADMYKRIAERPEWFQRPEIAIALARNHKVPADIATRALAHVAPDQLRQLAKGVGAPPHVIQAARKKVIDK